MYLLIEGQSIINEKEKLREELEWVRLSELLTPIHNFMYKRNDGRAWKPLDFLPYKPDWYKEDGEKMELVSDEDLQARLERLKKIFPDKK